MDKRGTELLMYFEPVANELVNNFDGDRASTFFDIEKHTATNTNLSPYAYDIALLGVPEDRNTQNRGCALAVDRIRRFFYTLYKPTRKTKIIDLGNFRVGKKVNDTYIGLRDVLAELLANNVFPIIIGGSQDLTYSNFVAYEKINKQLNLVSIDSRFDLGNAELDFNSRSYLSRIVLEKANMLLNYTNIGFQNYLNNFEESDLMRNLFFDIFRLGNIRADITETEPILRDADLVSFDMSVVRHSDAPANYDPSPNGIFAHEACQMAKYAGMSDRLTSFGIYEVNPNFDLNNQTSHLAAQIIWHCIDGYYSRKSDYPKTTIEHYTKFIVNLSYGAHEIVFYKSPKSGRWWMEVPFPGDNEKNILVACSHNDYLKASTDDVPERWWKYYQKIS